MSCGASDQKCVFTLYRIERDKKHTVCRLAGRVPGPRRRQRAGAADVLMYRDVLCIDVLDVLRHPNGPMSGEQYINNTSVF